MNAKSRTINRLVPPDRNILAPPQCIILTKNQRETIARIMLDENPKYRRKGKLPNRLIKYTDKLREERLKPPKPKEKSRPDNGRR